MYFSLTRICFFHQGGDLVRRSALLNGDGHMTHFYDDAKTMYEFFLRGLRVSSKYFTLIKEPEGVRKLSSYLQCGTFQNVNEFTQPG